MKKFIQANQKKLIALFSALLMIVFMLPSNRGANGAQQRVVGTVGSEKVYGTDLALAGEDWKELANIRWFDPQYRQVLNAQMMLQEPAYAAVVANPTTFFLLDLEARKEGIDINPDDVKSFITNNKITMPTTADDQMIIINALSRLMRVQALVDRAAGAVRISKPRLNQAMATDAQQVWFSVVEFPAQDFHPTTAPTTQEIDDQYTRFADVQPEQYNALTGNPFGFGYTHPDRVKFEYIEIPKAEIIEAVKQQIPPIQWAADEIGYRKAHPDEFPNPTTRPAGSSALAAAPLPWPSTQPFDPVNMPIFDKISLDKVAALKQQVQQRINATMLADFKAWHEAKTNSKPIPLSSVGVAYDAPEYLDALKASIMKDIPNFIPTVVKNDGFFKTQAQLNDEPGIGHAFTATQGVSFSTYVMTSAAPLLPADAATGMALPIMAPSVPLTDTDDNVFICRITDADKAAREHQQVVYDQVVQDVQTKKSMDLAHVAAQSLADAANSSGSLASAATTQGRKALVAGPVVPTPTATIPNYTLKPESDRILMEQFRAMLLSPKMTGTSKPVAVVDLPPDQKVVVVQFDTVVPTWTADNLAGKTAYEQSVLFQDALQPFLMEWCSLESVSARLDYHPNTP